MLPVLSLPACKIARRYSNRNNSLPPSDQYNFSNIYSGGVLILGELTCTLARIPMVFGTLSGWWMGEDDGRKYGPRMPESEWDFRLKNNGFNGLDLTFRDHDDPELFSVSLMVSTNLPLPDPSLPRKVVIVEPKEASSDIRQLSATLVKSLKSSGVEVKTTDLKNLVSLNIADQTCLSLLESESPVFPDISSEDFEAVKHLILNFDSTLWVTRGAKMETTCPEANMIAGLGRTIRGERPTTQLFTLDLDPAQAINSKSSETAIFKILRTSTEGKTADIPDWEYSVRDDKICIQRLDPDVVLDDILAASTSDPLPIMLPFKQPGRALALSIRSPGMLDTFEFIDDEKYAEALADDEVEIEVKATGMNFHDLMVALGQIFDTGLGVECSGVVTRTGRNVTKVAPGDRVITFGMGCYRTYYRNSEYMCEKIPDDMSFADAASIPCIYTTVYYSLIDMARLQAGESILIHAAAGGLGQAAIILAKHLGAEIFVTVSSAAKRDFLIEKYGILEDHVFNSRDLTFSQGVKRMTNGKGVDVVLNSLAGEALRQSWLCVAPFGRFIEVGKRDITGNTGIDMSPFMNNIVFAGVNMLSIYRTNVKLFSRIIGDVLKLLQQGIIKPVYPVKVWNFSQIEEAFRTMQTGKHIGKIVLTAGADDIVPVSFLSFVLGMILMIIRLYLPRVEVLTSLRMEPTSFQVV
jgi:NADPH:quinone reductase-like Zn-dependent oxidoreductase